MLKRENVSGAIEQFLAILKLKQATYDSVNDATQHLKIILTEIGRVEEAQALGALASKAQSRLGYGLREDARERLRQLVRKTASSSQSPIAPKPAPNLVQSQTAFGNRTKPVSGDDKRLEKLQKQIYSTTPFVGGLLRRKAAQALASDVSLQATQLLAEVVTRSNDETVLATAISALRQLSNQSSMDAVCEVWASTRHNELTRLLTEGNWVASSPAQLRVLTALKVSRLDVVGNGGQEIARALAQACEDTDRGIAEKAEIALRQLDDSEAQDAVCRVLIEQDSPVVLEVVLDTGYTPIDAHQQALFYFLTEQWENYERLDVDHEKLRLMYETAHQSVRRRVAKKAQQARRIEWVEVVSGGQQRGRIGEMTNAEWETTLAILEEGKHCEQMWALAQLAPARWSSLLLQHLKSIGWKTKEAGFDNLVELADKCGTSLPGLDSFVRCRATLEGHVNWVNCLAISSDGRVLASGGRDTTVRLWSLPHGKFLKTLEGHTMGVLWLAISPDGKVLVSGSRDDIALWTLPEGKSLKILDEHKRGVRCLTLSPAGTVFASGNEDNTVRLWRLSDGELITTLKGHIGKVNCLLINADGTVLASGSEDGTVQLWSLTDGRLIRTLGKQSKDSFNPVRNMAISLDGRVLATEGGGGSVKLWSLPDGKEPKYLKYLRTHGSSIPLCLASSPDGRVLVSGFGDLYQNVYKVHIWSLPDGELMKVLEEQKDFNTCLAISPNGRVLASGDGLGIEILSLHSVRQTGIGSGGKVQMWSLPDGKFLQTLKGHTEGISCLTISPDGTVLASGSNDNTVRLWVSRVFDLCLLPINELSLEDIEWAQKTLRESDLSPESRNWLELIVALRKSHHTIKGTGG
jgi:WD40 repeat protein